MATENGAPDLVVVMPAYNEEACIEAVTREWVAVARQYRGVLIVINDGSRDRTEGLLGQLVRELPELRVIHQPNAGHGAALLAGYRAALAARPKWIFQTDSDGQIAASEFDRLWSVRDEAPVILGHRFERRDPAHRKLISGVARGMIAALFGARGLADPNVPFRLMRSDWLAQALAQVPAGVFAPHLFLSILAAREGFREISVEHRPRLTGQPSLPSGRLLLACLRSAGELWRFRR